MGYLWNAAEIVTDRLVAPVAIATAIAFVLLGSSIFTTIVRPTMSPSGSGERRLRAVVVGGFAPMLLLLLVGGGFAYESGAAFAQLAERIAHTQEVRAELGRLYGSIADAQSAQRNHVLTGTTRYAEEFLANAREARQHVVTLGKLIADNPAQMRRHDQLGALIERKIEGLDRIDRVLGTSGELAARHALIDDQVFGLMQQIRDTVHAMDAAEAELLRQRSLAAQAQRQRTLVALLLTIVVASSMFAFLIRDIRRGMKSRGIADDNLRRLNATLEQRVETRTLELSYQQAFLRRVIDLNRNFIFAKDRDGRFVLANAAVADAYGTTPDGLVGKSDFDFNPNAEEVRRYLEDDNRVMQSGQELVIDEEQITNAKGEVRWLSTIKRPILSPDGSSTILLGVAADITVRKAAEDEVRQLNGDLERRVELRTRDLHDSNLKLEQARIDSEAASRAKSAFLANMSHEIRTPLNAIIGLTHLMRRDAHAPAQRERLDKVSGAAHHLLSVINDVLDLSKIESGKLELEAIDFSLEALVTQACSMVADDARAKGLELVIDTDGLPPLLHGDVTRLSQALVNLLGNAVKFTTEGSVSLRGDLLDSDESSLLVRFAIRDTGIGIGADRLRTLFNAFEQADSSTTRRFGGTGLGLSITRQLARLMGGDAGADSVVGAGSTFWFTARLERATQVKTQLSGTALSGLRGLIVDDLPEAREALRNMLEHIGLRVDTAASGEEGMVRAAAAEAGGDAFDIAVIDWKMPGMDGVETCRRLMAAPSRKPLRCVIVTANDSDKLRAAARAVGVDVVVVKPVSQSSLNDALTSSLSDKAVAQAVEPKSGEAFVGLRTTRFGARLLLAEDNLVNQEVAVELLRSANLHVDVVSNGREAVDRARTTRYDLILMDVQMPELDGMAATRMLRETQAGREVPVIAMTANAFGDDRSACLAAGMVDHIAKPVDPDVLYATLLRWLPAPNARGRTAGPANAAPIERQPMVARLSTVPGMDPTRGMKLFAGNANAYARVMRRFLATYAQDVPQIALAVASRSAAELSAAMHSVRGACGSVGAIELEAEAAALEALAKRSPWTPDMVDRARDLQQRLSRTVDRIKAVLTEEDDVFGTPSRY